MRLLNNVMRPYIRAKISLPVLLVTLIFILGGCEAGSERNFQDFSFDTLTLSDKPNQYLVSPADLTPLAKPHADSPVFNISAAALQEAFHAMAMAQPRTVLQEETADKSRARYVQRSLILRFPDIIDVRFLSPDTDTGTATLQIYSRSVYGYSDWGVNKSRIDSWLVELGKKLGAN